MSQLHAAKMRERAKETTAERARRLYSSSQHANSFQPKALEERTRREIAAVYYHEVHTPFRPMRSIPAVAQTRAP